MEHSRQIGKELAKEDANLAKIAPIPEQITCVLENSPPQQPIDLTLTGNLRGYRPQQLKTIFHNLSRMAATS